MDVALVELASHDVDAESPSSPDGSEAFQTTWIADPDGNRIELVQWPPATPTASRSPTGRTSTVRSPQRVGMSGASGDAPGRGRVWRCEAVCTSRALTGSRPWCREGGAEERAQRAQRWRRLRPGCGPLRPNAECRRRACCHVMVVAPLLSIVVQSVGAAGSCRAVPNKGRSAAMSYSAADTESIAAPCSNVWPLLPTSGGGASLVKTFPDVLLHRTVADHQGLGVVDVGAALGNQCQHLPLARGQLVGRVVATADEQLGHDLCVQHGAATGLA